MGLFEWLFGLSEAESVAAGLVAVIGAVIVTLYQLNASRIELLEQKTRELEATLDAIIKGPRA